MDAGAVAPTDPLTPARAGPPWHQASRHQNLRVAVLLLIVAIAVRAQTFGNPVLGYDEQFYLLVGDRMLQGALPFVDIFDRKPIGLFLIYAFIRLLGGEGTMQYEFVAGLFAWATAFLIWRFGRRVGGATAGIAAGIAYLLWLDFLEGEGGQAPVFFNLPMVAAALLTERLIRRRSITALSGVVPMLLVGTAIQIKYTAVFEGIFFGVALLWAARREQRSSTALMGMATCWVAAALAPTLAAYLTYAGLGQGQAFLFANFVSMFGKFPDPLETSALGLVTIIGVLAPLGLCAAFPPYAENEEQLKSRRFVLQWFAAAILGVVAMRSFSTPQYAMPVAVPAVIAAAPRLGAAGRSRRFILAGFVIAAIASQLVLMSLQTVKGRADQAALVARAATPRRGCLFVYDGYPALYRLTHSCLLSRYVFPGHLNMANEASVKALGVDPMAEVARIMALGPDTVVLDDPPFERVNEQTHAYVVRELARHYVRILSLQTGDRRRLVYRRRAQA